MSNPPIIPTLPIIRDLRVFEKTIVSRFSCLNTRLALDSTILFPKNAFKDSLKLIHKVRSGKDNVLEDKRIVSKILKKNENNQYRNAMMKPLSTGSIKKQKTSSFKKFNLIIESLSAEDDICHLFVIDIKFNEERANEKNLLFNEIYTPIFDKKKILPAIECSTFQLLGAMRLNDEGLLNSFKTTTKTHLTMEKKYFVPLYAEHIHFLVKKCN